MRIPRSLAVLPIFGLLVLMAAEPATKPTYVRKGSRTETIVASLKASGLPALDGAWHYVGPFDYASFEQVDPPEKEIDLTKTYPGKGQEKAVWKEMKDFGLDRIVNLNRFKTSDNSSVFL